MAMQIMPIHMDVDFSSAKCLSDATQIAHWHHAWAQKSGRLLSTCCCTMSYQVIQRYHPLVSGITTVSPGSTTAPSGIKTVPLGVSTVPSGDTTVAVLELYHQVLQQCLQHWQRRTPSVSSHYPSPLELYISNWVQYKQT